MYGSSFPFRSVFDFSRFCSYVLYPDALALVSNKRLKARFYRGGFIVPITWDLCNHPLLFIFSLSFFLDVLHLMLIVHSLSWLVSDKRFSVLIALSVFVSLFLSVNLVIDFEKDSLLKRIIRIEEICVRVSWMLLWKLQHSLKCVAVWSKEYGPFYPGGWVVHCCYTVSTIYITI